MAEQIKINWLITTRLNNDIADNEDMAKAVYNAMRSFSAGDFGKIPAEDIEANKRDIVAHSGHVLARYDTPNGDIYIDTRFNEGKNGEDVTMIMYCNEY